MEVRCKQYHRREPDTRTQTDSFTETGWPSTRGDKKGAAIASDANAATYWKSAVCGMLDWGVDLFYFEAFDEPNKQAATATDGTTGNEGHWGAFTSDRTPKFDLSC